MCNFFTISSSVFAEQLMVVNFDTTQPVPISPTLSGFNLNEISNTWQFEDPLYQVNATALNGKMFRFPGPDQNSCVLRLLMIGLGGPSFANRKVPQYDSKSE